MDFIAFMNLLAFKSIRELAIEYQEKLEKTNKSDIAKIGILSGFEGLDAITKGFKPGDLILIGGEKGMGKTSFAISLIAKMAIENKIPTAFFPLQIDANQILTNIISQQTKITLEKLRLNDLNENEIKLISEKLKNLSDCELYISEYPFRTIAEFEQELDCHPHDFAQVLIIDSLQLIGKSKNDKTGKVLNKKEITQITYRLKKIAEKFNVVIIALFDLKVDCDKYNCGRPSLRQVRKQAPIDAFADFVLLLYRPEYYKIEYWDNDENDPSNGQAVIIFAKNKYNCFNDRDIRIKFDGKIGGFDNLKK